MRSDLPTGTVTFLFSDVEGSTRLVRQLGERYPELLADHHRLLRAAFEAHGGWEMDSQGDGFCVVFARASEAVAAALAAVVCFVAAGIITDSTPSFAVSPDGRQLARAYTDVLSNGEGVVQLYDAPTGEITP